LIQECKYQTSRLMKVFRSCTVIYEDK
jgi:hypothetical protein